MDFYISIMIFTGLLFYIGSFLLFKELSLLLFPVMFGHFFMFLSCVFLESSPVYISEQAIFSERNYSSMLLILFDFFLFFGVFIAYKACSLKHSRSLIFKPAVPGFILLSVCFVVFLLYVNVFLTGSPLWQSSITRFNYWEMSKIPMLGVVLGDLATPLVLVISVMFSWFSLYSSKKTTYCWGGVFFLMFIYYFLIGHKFSAQFFSLTIFFGVYYSSMIFNRKILFDVVVKRVFFWGAGLSGVLLCFVYFKYSQEVTGIVANQGGVLNAIVYRIFGLQGHVWWGVYEFSYLKPDELAFDYNYFVRGIESIMMQVGDPGLVSVFLEKGIRFSMGFPAILIGSSSLFIALMMDLMFGLTIGFLIALFLNSISKGRVFFASAILGITVTLEVVVNMGAISDLYSGKMLMYIFSAILLIVLGSIRLVNHSE